MPTLTPLLSPANSTFAASTSSSPVSSTHYDHLLVRSYRPHLILLSFLVCFLGSYTTTQLYAQSRLLSRNVSTIWLLLASVAFGGCALWSFHFVAMMAVDIGVPVSFNMGLTTFSAVFAVVGSLLGLGGNVILKRRRHGSEEGYETASSGGYVSVPTSVSDEEESRGTEEEYNMVANLWRNRRQRNHHQRKTPNALSRFLAKTEFLLQPRIHFVGGSMGLTVAGMHYIGMRAMRFEGYIVWNPFIIALSVIISHVVCVIAVCYMPDSDDDGYAQLTFAIVAAVGINAMHWTGMGAATFRSTVAPPHGDTGGFPTILPLTVAFVSLFTCLLSYAALARNALRARDTLVEMIVTKRRLWKAVAEKEAADRSNKIKTDFINVASHELRTPLHAITGFTDLLELTDMSDEQREFVSAIKASCHTLDLISRNVLDFARLESDGEGCENGAVPAVVDVAKLARDTLRTCASSALTTKSSAVDLVFVVDEGVKEAVLDETYFARVIMNLVGNALKFTRSGYVLCHISMSPTPDSSPTQSYDLNLTVSDTGIGISPANQKLIFEPFQQADTSLTRKHLGTGLGLTICRQLVSKMGGRIELKSDEGKGSEFRVVFGGAVPGYLVDREEYLLNGTAGKDKMKLALCLSPQTSSMLAPKLEESFDVTVIDHSTSASAAMATADRVLVDASYLHPTFFDGALDTQVRYCFGEPRPVPPRTAVLPKLPMVIDSRFIDTVKVGRQVDSKEDLIQPMTSLINGTAKATALKKTTDAPSRGRILLVEDNPVNQTLGAKMLEKLNLSYDVAENGQVALDHILGSSHPYSLVLMDTQMPVLDGLEATRTIREYEKNGRLKGHLFVISLTANVSVESRRECKEAGSDSFLPKPITLGRLRNEVERVLKMREEEG